MRRRTSTRWGLIAALAAVAALVVSPSATTASYTITAGGPAVVVSVANAGGTSNATFPGISGQRISLNFTNVTITSTKVSILKPNGTNLLTPFTVTKAGYFLDVQTLPTTGTYKILVDPKDTYTGSMKLRLYDVPADATASLTAGGAPGTVNTTVPGQNATFTFSGTADQRVSLDLNSVTYPSGKLKIFNPDSTPLLPSALSFSQAGRFVEPVTLPQTGLYTVLVDPGLLAVGTASAQLYNVPADQNAAITACTALPCTPSTANTTGAGQNAHFTFSGTANQRVSLLAGSSTYASPVKVSIIKPDQTPLFSPALTATGFDAFADVRTLPTTGTYEVFVNPQGADTGTLDVTLYSVPVDQTGTITPGVLKNATTTMPGQNALFTFAGAINQRVSLNLTSVTYDSAKVSILKPDGSQLAAPLFVPNTLGDFQEPLKLPSTGTYTVFVDPLNASTGSLDVGLYFVANDFTGALTNGVAKNVQITSPGQNAVLTYSGTAGQRITLTATNVALGDSDCCAARLRILRPDGTTLLKPPDFGNTGTYVDTVSLTQNGTYKVKIDPIDETIGQLDLTLYVVPPDATATAGALTASGTSASVTTTAPGQNGRISFAGIANGRFAFKFVSFQPVYCAAKVSILRPDGTTFKSNQCAEDGQFFDTMVLPVTGTYKIVIDPQGNRTGTANLVLYSVPADVVTTLGSGVTLSPGQKAFLSFTGSSGQTATVTPGSGGTIDLARATLVKSDKTTEIGNAEYWDPVSVGTPVAALLPTTGTYYLKYDPVGGASGTSMNFSLSFS